MSPEHLPPGSPQSWLRYAKADLSIVRSPKSEDGLYEILCYHAQQSVEKSLKAVLIHLGIEFPKIHLIEKLIDLLPESISKPPALIQSIKLSPFATVSRYPSEEEVITEEEFNEALSLTESVYTWADGIISGGTT